MAKAFAGLRNTSPVPHNVTADPSPLATIHAAYKKPSRSAKVSISQDLKGCILFPSASPGALICLKASRLALANTAVVSMWILICVFFEQTTTSSYEVFAVGQILSLKGSALAAIIMKSLLSNVHPFGLALCHKAGASLAKNSARQRGI